MAPGSISLQLAEDAADSLAAIEDKAERETNQTLRLALLAMLLSLKPALIRYQQAVANPETVSPAELTSRYQDVIRTAQRFLSDAELRTWEAKFTRHLEAAMLAGAKAAEQDLKLEQPDTAPPPTQAPDPVVVASHLQSAGQALRGEAAGFRAQLLVMVGIAATQGWGAKRFEVEARRALQGIRRGQSAARGSYVGAVQRVAVQVRTTLQRAFQHVNNELQRAAGVEYVRWVATRDERTCAYCVARHGRVYRREEVSVPAHMRCRCRLVPLDAAAVNNPDPAERDQQLDGHFWRQSQQRIWREYAASKGKTLQEARPEILRAANTPTANEKWRQPGTTTTAKPVRTLDGPGGRDLGTAVRDANKKQGR